MITIFNRKEVYVGMSMNEFNDKRQLLSQNGIGYRYRMVNQNSVPRGAATVGRYMENQDLSTTYYIYVNKKDYEYACGLLHKASD